MATLKKRGKSWQLSWVVPSACGGRGKQHKKSLGQITKAEAEAKLNTKERELTALLNEVERRQANPHRMTLAEFIDTKFLQWYELWHPSSWDRVESALRLHLEPILGHAYLQDISATDARDWLTGRLGDGAALGTVDRELTIFKSVMSRALEWGMLDPGTIQSPLKGISAPKDRTREGAPPPFLETEELEILYRFSIHHHLIWRFYANTGLRRAEGLQVRKRDIRNGFIHVLSLTDAETKTGKWRQVKIPDALDWVIQALMDRSTTEYLLPRLSRVSLTRAFRTCARRALQFHPAEFPAGATLHWLRHTYITHLLGAGVPTTTVQALAGHTRLSTTERYAWVRKTAQDHPGLANLAL